MNDDDIRHDDVEREPVPSSSASGFTSTSTAVFGVAECNRGRTRSDGAVLDAGDKRATLRMGESTFPPQQQQRPHTLCPRPRTCINISTSTRQHVDRLFLSNPLLSISVSLNVIDRADPIFFLSPNDIHSHYHHSHFHTLNDRLAHPFQHLPRTCRSFSSLWIPST